MTVKITPPRPFWVPDKVYLYSIENVLLLNLISRDYLKLFAIGFYFFVVGVSLLRPQTKPDENCKDQPLGWS